MGKIALIACDLESRARFLGTKPIPANYMGDFSLIGFIVDRLPEACALLANAGYQVEQRDGGADITFDSVERLAAIPSLLANNRIACQFADVADTLYQA